MELDRLLVAIILVVFKCQVFFVDFGDIFFEGARGEISNFQSYAGKASAAEMEQTAKKQRAATLGRFTWTQRGIDMQNEFCAIKNARVVKGSKY